jgi:hypothetical protein
MILTLIFSINPRGSLDPDDSSMNDEMCSFHTANTQLVQFVCLKLQASFQELVTNLCVLYLVKLVLVSYS